MLCLSREDLTEWSGFRRPSSVCSWLRREGVVFAVAADGWPRVSLDAFRARMTGVIAQRPSSPNTSALALLQGGHRGKKTSIQA